MSFHILTISHCQDFIQTKNPLILDYRDIKSYQLGHLEGALHVHDNLKVSLIKKGDKNRPVLIYCYHGHASQHLAEFFTDFGFKDVYSLDGGYTAWENAQIA